MPILKSNMVWLGYHYLIDASFYTMGSVRNDVCHLFAFSINEGVGVPVARHPVFSPALLLHCTEGNMMRNMRRWVEYSPHPVQHDNATAVGIANNTAKRLCSKSIEMRLFWIADQEKLGCYAFKWYQGRKM